MYSDAIVIAVGAQPNLPKFPGANKKNVVWVGDVDLGKVQVGNTVVIACGGLTGCETALYLAQQGKKVTIVEMITLEEMIANAPIISMVTLISLLRKNKVKILTEMKLDQITDTTAVIIDKNSKKTELPCDTVVLSLGVTPRTEVVEMFEDLVNEFYVIGDCTTSRGSLWTATTTGFDAAMDI